MDKNAYKTAYLRIPDNRYLVKNGGYCCRFVDTHVQ